MLVSASAREMLSKEVEARDDEVRACQQRIHMLQEEALGHRQQLHTAHAETGGTSVTHCNTMQSLQHTATRCNPCNTLLRAAHCQHARAGHAETGGASATYCNTLQSLQHAAITTTCCNMLQHCIHYKILPTANIYTLHTRKLVVFLQHTATRCDHCKTPQHFATRCDHCSTLST